MKTSENVRKSENIRKFQIRKTETTDDGPESEFIGPKDQKSENSNARFRRKSMEKINSQINGQNTDLNHQNVQFRDP